MSRDDDVLVVGAGQAGVQVACLLRDAGHRGAVTLVGEEPVPPYQRPPLSKGFLTGTLGADALALRDQDYWGARDIGLVLGEAVTEVVRGGHGSGRARTDRGRTVAFDRLVLATGATPRRLDVPGGDADGVLTLRTLADAGRLRDRLRAARDVVVVGGGFIGLEVAATAAALGARVFVLEAGSRILGRVVSEATAQHLAAHHHANGVEIRTRARIVEVVTDGGDVRAVLTTDGAVRADLVLVGIGAAPRTGLAASLGLRTDGGVVVDEHALASDGTTLAVGDCTVLADPTPWGDGETSVRLESVDHAVEHAATAVRTILGESTPHTAVPWFWSDQGSAKLQIVGLRRPGDVATLRPSGSGRHVVGFHRRGRLVAAEVVGSPAEFMALRTLLGARHPVPVEVFADPEVALRQLAKQARSATVTAR
ncbi:FAD-dependent oxidoreductase [Nocardioides ochotonae]|uniref:FAD-dependent oxidoreductase n=1 Tax=Nocardioides ochotonae TaxID=2685869 RepID=UPI00140E040C